jgi:hypothetical protein
MDRAKRAFVAGNKLPYGLRRDSLPKNRPGDIINEEITPS